MASPSLAFRDDLGLPADRPLLPLAQLAERAASAAVLHAIDVRGAGTALALAALVGGDRSVVAVTKNVDEARRLQRDLTFALGADAPALLLLDPGDQMPWSDAASDRRAAHARLSALHQLATEARSILFVPAAALVHRVVSKRWVADHTLHLRTLDEVDRDEWVERLTDLGYLRSPLVEDPGTLSVRGSLLDVWPPGRPAPIRIELDGDLVASLKTFDPENQRSGDELEDVALLPAREALADDPAAVREKLRDCCDAVNWPSSKTRTLIADVMSGRTSFGLDAYLPAFVELEPLTAQLPADAMVVIDDPQAVVSALQEELERAEISSAAHQSGPHFGLDAFFVGREAVDGWLATRPHVVSLARTAVVGGDAGWVSARHDDDVPSLATFDQNVLVKAIEAARKSDGHGAGLEPLLQQVERWTDQGLHVVLSCRTVTQAERLGSILVHRGLEVAGELGESLRLPAIPLDGPAAVRVVVGELTRGVIAPLSRLVLITEEEVFGARVHRRRRAKAVGKRRTQQLLEDLRSLAVGEHVVHVEHGIGRYGGLIHRDVGGHTVDLMVVEYAGGDKLYLPVYRLNQIHKFRGGEGNPKLDRLGGQSFARTKSKAKKKIRDIADQLLRLYAEREQAEGIPTAPIDDEYRAFEAAFPYEETEDQARAIVEVNADLEMVRPMDRLVCGDVGFGKTEIALRAAFRVAMTGRQVAVLCPTTVLAQQHARTFSQRFAGYPIKVVALSRFQSKKELDAAVKGMRDGTIDVVIGTHRLLSKDVHFKQLGLLVVDEEQRFGVTAKERLKSLRTNVDVLTLSATPIPRTMQMAISGLRDLSVMTTPPADRRPVRTVVTRHDRAVLQEALEREFARGGQVFWVFNRIGGLDERAGFIHALVPDARIAVAHGQMKERALEKAMLDFIEGKHDVLCTTAIVENGLDIPRANTIVVDRADLLGLSQLYQLRGRVGRSRERGYCYLVLPPGGDITADAQTRMEALQQYSDLGSGFQIASLDLDLRGGGDLLGAEQSGTIAAVGVEMFASMLQQATAELSGEETVADIDPELSFDVEALLPQSYIPDVGVRLSLYKRLASALAEYEVHELSEEMEDRFGRPPPEAKRFVQMMHIKCALRRLRVLACEASFSAVRLHLRDDTPLDPAKVGALLQKGQAPLKLTPDMRIIRKRQDGEVYPSSIELCEQLLRELAPASGEPST